MSDYMLMDLLYIFSNDLPKTWISLPWLTNPSGNSELTLQTRSLHLVALFCLLKRDFPEKLKAMDLTMLTCLNTPSRFVFRELDDDLVRNFKLDLDALENSVVCLAEFTWRKFQRVLDQWRGPYKSNENAYYVFHLLDLGCQLADKGDKGCIVDPQASNSTWNSICKIYLFAIPPADSVVVEAILASEFQDALQKFRSIIAESRRRRKELGCVACSRPKQPKAVAAWNDGICPVCLERLAAMQCPGFVPADAGVKLVNCGHCFHAACVAQIL